jgi:hypothetical protein
MAKRYHRGNQNPYIKEEQTTQWPKDTTGAIRIRISKKNRQHNGQKIPQGQSESVYQRRIDNTMVKDTTGVIRIRISKKNRQPNGQKIP